VLFLILTQKKKFSIKLKQNRAKILEKFLKHPVFKYFILNVLLS